MGNYITEQLARFLQSIVLGLSLGLVYDLLRTLRRLGGAWWGGVLDGLYALLAVGSVFFFVMGGDGELRLFILLGALGGMVLFFCLLSRPLRPVWAFWLEAALVPVALVKKILEKVRKISQKLFSFPKKWGTIILIRLRRLKRRPEGEEAMAAAKDRKRPAKQRKKVERKPPSKLALLLLTALITLACVQLYSVAGQLREAAEEEEAYSAQVSELEKSNEQLQRDLDNSGNLELIEDIARDELGLVSEGEKIFRFGK